MVLLEYFICFLAGIVLLTLCAFIFKLSGKMFALLLVSSVIAGFALFILAIVGFRFCTLTPFACLITGFLGIVGFLLTYVFNLIF